MSRRLRKKNAIRGIESAFKGVALEDGVSLHETLEIDDYRRVLRDSNSRRYDEIYDWRKLINSPHIQKFCWNGGITFFDGKGFRFHIPAYLIMTIRSNKLGDISDIMISNLTRPHDLRREGFKLFSSAQKRAIFSAVLYLYEYDIISLDEEAFAGLYKYWA